MINYGLVMDTKQKALFVRIDTQIKDKLDEAAKAERRSAASLIEAILREKFEVRNEQG
tara:strand:+ start:299 stop:472 length:174 start_codon:yes stop_codon:yes gene_type:complete